MEKTRFARVYLRDVENKNDLHLLYENKNKNLLLRSRFDLNKRNEEDCLEEFIDTIVSYETNGINKYNKIEFSKDSEDSHNKGLIVNEQ